MAISPFNRVRAPAQRDVHEEQSPPEDDEASSIGEMISVALADIAVGSMDDVAEGIRGGRLGKGGARRASRGLKPLQPTKARDNDTIAEKVRQAVSAGVTASAIPSDTFEAGADQSAHRDVTGAASTTPIASTEAGASSVKAWTVAPIRIKG